MEQISSPITTSTDFFARHQKAIVLGSIVVCFFGLVALGVVYLAKKVREEKSAITFPVPETPLEITQADTTPITEIYQRELGMDKEKEKATQKNNNEFTTSWSEAYSTENEEEQVPDTVYKNTSPTPKPIKRRKSTRHRTPRHRPTQNKEESKEMVAQPPPPQRSEIYIEDISSSPSPEKDKEAAPVYISATIFESRRLRPGQTIRVQFQEPALTTQGVFIPKRSIGTALVTTGGSRLALTVHSVTIDGQILPVQFEAYDASLTPGLPLEKKPQTNVQREVVTSTRDGQRYLQNLTRDIPLVPDMTRGVIRASRSLFRNKNGKVSLPENYTFYLKIN